MSSHHWTGAFLALFLVAYVGLPLAAVLLVGGYLMLAHQASREQ